MRPIEQSPRFPLDPRLLVRKLTDIFGQVSRAFKDVVSWDDSLPALRRQGFQLEGNWLWRDKEGLIYPDATAGAVRGQFITGVYAYSYANNKTLDFSFHLPHDWVPSSDLFLHIHWAHNAGVTVSGPVVFNFKISYAKGHNQADFSAAISPSLTYQLTSLTATPQYRHRIDEFQLSASSPTATQLDTDDIEVDGLIQGTMTVDLSGATLTTTTPVNSIYVFTLDLHYQSSNAGTLSRSPSPSFYYITKTHAGSGSLSASSGTIAGTGTRT